MLVRKPERPLPLLTMPARGRFVNALTLGLHAWPSPQRYQPEIRKCFSWTVVDWSFLSNPTRAVPASLPDEIQPIQKGASSFNLTHGGTSFVENGKEKIFSIPAQFHDVDAVLVRLRNAWLETPAGQEVLALHTDCQFHLFSGAHVQPLASNPPSEPPRHSLSLEAAVHFHWMHGYYQGVGEILPKLLLVKRLKLIENEPTLKLVLKDRPYMRYFLKALGFEEERLVFVKDDQPLHVTA